MSYQSMIEEIIEKAIAEDGVKSDVTTGKIIDKKMNITGSIITKTSGVVSGVEIACKVFNLINPKIKLKIVKESGSYVNRGDALIAFDGPAIDILKGETIAVNILQRMSSISTITNRYVKEVSSTDCKILDTRNNTPNFRVLEKRAVLDGGGYNDIFSLSERVVINRNHVACAKGVIPALEKFGKSDEIIQIEVEDLKEFQDALESKCDVITMLDFNEEELKVAVNANDSKILVAKGSYSLSSAFAIAKTGVNYIALDCLTSNIKPLDISLRIYKGL